MSLSMQYQMGLMNGGMADAGSAAGTATYIDPATGMQVAMDPSMIQQYASMGYDMSAYGGAGYGVAGTSSMYGTHHAGSTIGDPAQSPGGDESKGSRTNKSGGKKKKKRALNSAFSILCHGTTGAIRKIFSLE